MNFLGRVLFAALAMGLSVLLVRFILDRLLVTTDSTLGVIGTVFAIIKLLLELGVGVCIFFFGARALHIEQLNLGPIRRLLDRLRLSWL